MPKFYPSQEIIDDVFAMWIYDQFKNNKEIPIPNIKDRKKYLGIYESFKIVSEFEDDFSNGQVIRDKSIAMMLTLEAKFNKMDYPELWI